MNSGYPQEFPKFDCPRVVQYSKFQVSSENKTIRCEPLYMWKGQLHTLKIKWWYSHRVNFPSKRNRKRDLIKIRVKPNRENIKSYRSVSSIQGTLGAGSALPCPGQPYLYGIAGFSPHDHFLGWLCSMPAASLGSYFTFLALTFLLTLLSSPQIHILPSEELLTGTCTCHILPCFPGFPLKYW